MAELKYNFLKIISQITVTAGRIIRRVLAGDISLGEDREREIYIGLGDRQTTNY